MCDGKAVFCRAFVKVSDGTRTRDRLDHNQELYQLSYAHHAPPTRATLGSLAPRDPAQERDQPLHEGVLRRG
jgi:hypothetical protein